MMFQHRIIVEFENETDREGVYRSVSRSSYFDGKNSTGAAVLMRETLCPKCEAWFNSAFKRCLSCVEKEEVSP